MKKLLGFLPFLFLSFQVLSQSVSILNGENSFRIANSNLDGFDFKLEINNLKLDNFKTEMGDFYKLVSQDFNTSLAEGEPELLFFNRLFELPVDADIQIVIINKQEITIDLNTYGIHNKVFPHQASTEKIRGIEKEFKINKTTYKTNQYYSQPLVQTTYLGQMRQTRLARVSISPFSYNPVQNTLTIVTSLEVELRFKNADLPRTIIEKQNYYSPAFNFVSGSIVNAKVFSFLPPSASQAAERMVIITDSNNRKTLKPFVAMKERQGFDVTVSYTQNPQVGTSLTSIKAYLQGLYNNSATAPSYAILVGDVAQIPAHTGIASSGHITDLYYFEYTNDDFPEIFYGRFSCEDTNELHNIIEKTLEYEQYLMPNPNYLDTSVLIAGYDNSYGPTHGNGQVNYGSTYYYNTSKGITPLLYLYPGSSSAAAQIRADASRGVAMLNYSAHGNYNGWEDPSFKNTNVTTMTNEHKYPIMIGNACLTGTFNMSDCFGEVLTNASKKGAVGYIGASNNTYWDEDFYWAVGYTAISANPTYSASSQGFFDGIFHSNNEPYNQWSTSLAQIITKGNLAVTQSGSRVKYYWEVYHCFGDPSLVHYTHKPTAMNPTHNSMIPIGFSSFLVNNAEPYALVSLSIHDTLIGSAYADSTGDALLNFAMLNSPNSATLTITAQNKIPYTASIVILSPNGPYLNLLGYSLNDLSGNNNQKADNGELVKLNVNLNNLTSFSTGMVQLKLTTLDSSVLITDSLDFLSVFSGLDTVSILDAFEIQIKNAVEDGRSVKLQLKISDSTNGVWNYYLQMPLLAPRLTTVNMTIDDASLGNGNGLVEAGETIILEVKVKNNGSNDLQNISGTLIPKNNLLIGSTNPVLISQLKADSADMMYFTLVVQASAKMGAYCPLDFVGISNGYKVESNFYVVIGDVDEDFESGDYQKFEWVKLNNNDWNIDSANVHGGKYSAKSGVLGNSSESGITLDMNVLINDSIIFYVKTSTETGYDFLEFRIDNLPAGNWSGIMNWTRIALPVNAGKHNFTWVYSKDNYGVGGMDAVWIDDINFPLTDVLSKINESSLDNNNLTIYPNPANEIINLIYSSDKSEKVSISIIDLQGRIIQKMDVESNFGKGSHSTLVDVKNLKSGIYFIVLTIENQEYKSKFIKL